MEAQQLGKSEADIFFSCPQCSTSLVVNRAAAGMTVNCQRCGKPTVVPTDGASPVSDLQRQLRENESQRTEITNYINQLTIQLHRWQHRLKNLNERNSQLVSEISDSTRSPR